MLVIQKGMISLGLMGIQLVAQIAHNILASRIIKKEGVCGKIIIFYKFKNDFKSTL